MRLLHAGILLAAGAGFLQAQLTMDQKMADFQYLASIYAKGYGPYEWKRDVIGFDLFNLAPWLDKVRKSKSDLEFYDVMSEYVSSLNDAHDLYVLPANFVARLNFSVDLYDGKTLVDSINRSRLPVSEFPFAIGYELVSIDGEPTAKMMDRFERYNIAANPRSTRRGAAGMITTRPQAIYPYAADVPEISTVVFRRYDGNLETYRIPWAKAGLPFTGVGKVPYFNSRPKSDDAAPTEPDYMQPLKRLWNCKIGTERAVLGEGALAPIFAASMPAGFQIRLGRGFNDFFYSGTFTAGPYKIGFIRIPDYAPFDENTAINQFFKEIQYFQANTDGLIIDDTRNPGGSVAYLNVLVSLLMPNRWRALAFEVRATSSWVAQISSALESAKAQRAPQNIIDALDNIKTELVNANQAIRGRTNPIPLDDVTIDRDPALDNKGNFVGYSKPIMVLIDEYSASGGDAFPATMQDNARAVLLGWRTMGAGGSVTEWDAGSYSTGWVAYTSLTESLMNRKAPTVTKEYPAAPYVENIGVRPDIEVDYMTRDNLLQNGKPFVDRFVAEMIDYITKNR